MNEPTAPVSLLESTSAITLADDVPAALDRLVTATCRTLVTRVCGAWLAAREGGQSPLVVQQGSVEGALDPRQLADAAARWCYAHPHAAKAKLDGQDLGEPLEELFSAVGCHTLIAAPLVVEGQPMGLAFAGLDADEARADPDLRLLQALACVGESTIERLCLAERLDRQRRHSDALYRVSQAFAAALDVEPLLSLIVRLAIDAIPQATNGVLHLLDEETGELHPRALSFMGEVRPDVAGRSQMRQGYGVAGLALEQGQVINVPDVSQDPRFVRVGEVRPFASMLVSPLLLGERRIGTLSIDSPRTNAFTQEDEHLLLTLATQAAAAIENARLLGDLQQSISDLERTQDQLIQAEKLSAIGQLIAGVAHELNNPLTAIMGYAQLLEAEQDLDEGLARDLAKIRGQAERAARIVQNLLTFARQQQFRREFLDMNDIIARTVELRAYQLRVSNVQVHQCLAEEPLGVLADASQMQQVLLNLINNAHDAIKSSRAGGNITITSRRAGAMVQVQVSDDGPGLPPEVRKHLFEPFFTTKEVGKGTGLGLSICYGILTQHGGRIWAEGEPGEGATFVIELPAATPQSPPRPQAEAVPIRPLQGCSVLLVEDEEEIASSLQRCLIEDGHRVSVARDGKSALERIAEMVQSGASPDLVISDIKMPGLDGPALYEQLRRQDARLAGRVLFITGDTLSPDTSSFLARSGVPCLPKPFTVQELRRAIAGVLDMQEAPSPPEGHVR